VARPRKVRVGEYAGLLAEELLLHLDGRIMKSLAAGQAAYVRELERLRKEIQTLERRIETLEERLRAKTPRPKVGRWVPGGPGRPPKDADERIAAFTETKARKKTTQKRTKKRRVTD
jgi:hypothetical protein